ncbi:peroxiredoxin [Georgenia sp. Z1344]|uniref:peroxiredoxin n=1 Tax=Georgenia sp. Z1344 TaxID=3416706 RepID=UPI003CF4F267
MTAPAGARLAIGSAAPGFSLPAHTGAVRTLDELLAEGRTGLIVYFYPQALTPACRQQTCDARDRYDVFTDAGYALVGISPDPVERLARAVEQDAIPFDLLSDEDHAVSEAWGTWGEKKNYGRTYEGLIRSTAVLDPDGVVSWVRYNVRAKGHMALLARELGLAAAA